SMQDTPAPGAPKPSGTVKEPSRNRQSRAKEKRSEIISILSEVCSPMVAEEFEAHRREIGNAMTPRAARMTVKSLIGHHDPDAVLNLSIQNGWRGVFPHKVGPRLTTITGGLRDDKSSRRYDGHDPHADATARRIAFAAGAGRSPSEDCF
ncbi:hypothetical protein, partial [Mameliella sp. MMSF_3552]